MTLQSIAICVAGLMVLALAPAAWAQEQGFVGAGIALRQDEQGQVIIERVLDGGPAAQAGVQPGDLLLAVGDRDVRQLPFDQIPSLVRGPVGSQVALWVVTPGQAPRQVTLTRAPIAGPIPPNPGNAPTMPPSPPPTQAPAPATPNPWAGQSGIQPAPPAPQQAPSQGQFPQQAGDAQARPTPQNNPPAPGPAPAGGRTLRFVRTALRDPQVGNEEAVIMLVPAGWQMQGQVVWMHNYAVLANALIRVSDPQSGAQIDWLPFQNFTFTPNAPVPMQPFQNYMGQVWLQPIADGPAFVQAFWMGNALQHLRNARLVGQQDVPAMASEFVRLYGGPAQARGYRLRYEYEVNGQMWEEDVWFALLFAGSQQIQQWQVNFATARRAPKGTLDRLAPEMNAMVASAYYTPRWSATLQVCRQLFRQGLMEKLRDERAFAAKLQEYRDHTFKLSQQIHEERMASMDRRSETFREALGGIETYRDTYKHELVQLPQGYKEYWVNAKGEYILSDQWGFNPNHGNTEEWRKMDRRDPMNPGPEQ